MRIDREEKRLIFIFVLSLLIGIAVAGMFTEVILRNFLSTFSSSKQFLVGASIGAFSYYLTFWILYAWKGEIKY